MADLTGKFFGKGMPSPFILGSGPISYDSEGIWEAYQSGAGAVTTKTLCIEKAVNPIPHITLPHSSNLRGSLLNSEKWSDLTWEKWVEEEFYKLADHPGVLIASIGHTAADARLITTPVVNTGVVDAIECVAYTKETLVALIQIVRERTDLPILAKLSFNWGDDLYRIAEEALQAGANGLTAIDSIGPVLEIDIETRQPVLGSIKNRAWLSGTAIRPIALAVVAKLCERFNVPVIGMGGVMQAEDAIEMSMVGASAIGVCTAPIIKGLNWFNKTNEKLNKWLDQHDYASFSDTYQLALSEMKPHENLGILEFKFDPLICTKCNSCVDLCPYNARSLTGDQPKSSGLFQHVDEHRCRSCGLCVSVCPSGALSFANWPKKTVVTNS